MSLRIPPELNWLVLITAGQNWPKGDEDRLRELAQVWRDTASELNGLVDGVDPLVRSVLGNVHGASADQFAEFATALRAQVPALIRAADSVGRSAFDTAAEVEYAKYMIIAQMIVLAAEIAWCLANAPWTFGASTLMIGPLIAAARTTVMMILRRLAMHIGIEMGTQLGLDVVIQTLQLLKGDRTSWNTGNTAGAAVTGALGGGFAGFGSLGLSAIGSRIGRDLADGLGGRVVNAGVAGGLTTVASNAIYGDDQSAGLAAGSSALSGVAGGRRGGGAHGGAGGGLDVDVPSTPTLGEGGAPGAGGGPGGGGSFAGVRAPDPGVDSGGPAGGVAGGVSGPGAAPPGSGGGTSDVGGPAGGADGGGSRAGADLPGSGGGMSGSGGSGVGAGGGGVAGPVGGWPSAVGAGATDGQRRGPGSSTSVARPPAGLAPAP
ncbi:MAG: hypothetical protein QOJ30_1614, partial [Pseudonocardiales bacterium]|nr:hypothetical protein [Pseudonocardiales bacterium]